MMSLDHTAEILAGPRAIEHWRELVAHRVDDLTATVERLRQAIDALTHLGKCPRDDPLSCPVTAERVEARVAKAIAGD
ncbi:hypothetical protein AB0N89_36695 [Amycolatopsis sp. NPDC089917]|uniref:hypothetical protein n=1 Tax=Amycolatopsis sp. NPDC089917 TaxID=3155187 RepID=UPI0034327734